MYTRIFFTGYKPEFIEKLVPEVMETLKNVYKVELELDEVENVTCEVLRRSQKKDVFYQDQDLFIVIKTKEGEYHVMCKKFGEKEEWEMCEPFEHPDIM